MIASRVEVWDSEADLGFSRGWVGGFSKNKIENLTTFFFRSDQISFLSSPKALKRRCFDPPPPKSAPVAICVSLQVLARSVVDPSITSEESTVRVTVEDVNDNGPVFSQTTYSFSIAENTQTPAALGTVSHRLQL